MCARARSEQKKIKIKREEKMERGESKKLHLSKISEICKSPRQSSRQRLTWSSPTKYKQNQITQPITH